LKLGADKKYSRRKKPVPKYMASSIQFIEVSICLDAKYFSYCLKKMYLEHSSINANKRKKKNVLEEKESSIERKEGNTPRRRNSKTSAQIAEKIPKKIIAREGIF